MHTQLYIHNKHFISRINTVQHFLCFNFHIPLHIQLAQLCMIVYVHMTKPNVQLQWLLYIHTCKQHFIKMLCGHSLEHLYMTIVTLHLIKFEASLQHCWLSDSSICGFFNVQLLIPNMEKLMTYLSYLIPQGYTGCSMYKT